MKIDQIIKGFLLAALVASVLPHSQAWASPQHHSKWDRKIALTCARVKNIVMPNKNTQLNTEQLGALHACIKQYRSNLQTCMKNASVTMNSLTKEQIPTLRKCEAQAVSQIK